MLITLHLFWVVPIERAVETACRSYASIRPWVSVYRTHVKRRGIAVSVTAVLGV